MVDAAEIRLFCSMYQEYIDEFDLSKNDVLMLFLAELRYLELAYKLTEKEDLDRMLKPLPLGKNKNVRKVRNETIIKWWEESLQEDAILTPEYVANMTEGIRYRTMVRRMETRPNEDDMGKIWG